jgi:2-polyprenyl-6-methoxyphenol hydroxylase-like FAD-dependent oxidoreductase
MKNDRVLHWLMRTTDVPPVDLRALARKGVFLIGDAAHAQPILGGSGGNLAIIDALQLAEHIAKHGTDHSSDFVDAQLPRWERDAVNCRKRIDEMHAPRSPSKQAKEHSSSL